MAGGAGLLRGVAVAVAVVLSLSLHPGLRAETAPAADAGRSRSLVNAARAGAGLSTLAPHAGLDSVARSQAGRMAARKAIYHNPDLGSEAEDAGANWQTIGENVGVGHDIDALHQAFMNSPGHHKNVVYPAYGALGVGVVRGGDGRLYIAHVFARLRSAAQASVAQPPEPPSEPAVQAPVNVTTPPSPELESPDPNAVTGGIVNV